MTYRVRSERQTGHAIPSELQCVCVSYPLVKVVAVKRGGSHTCLKWVAKLELVYGLPVRAVAIRYKGG